MGSGPIEIQLNWRGEDGNLPGLNAFATTASEAHMTGAD